MKILNTTDKNKCNCVLWLRERLTELPFGLWTLDDKEAIINSQTPVIGSGAMCADGIWFTHEGKKVFSGHVALVTEIKDDIITIQEANYKSCTVTEREGTKEKLKIVGFFVPERLKNNLDKMKEKNQEFYADKLKKQGWSSLEDWVEAAREYKDERDQFEKELEEANDNATKFFNKYQNLVKAQDQLNKAHDLELKRTKDALTKEYNTKLIELQNKLEVCEKLKQGAEEILDGDQYEEIKRLKNQEFSWGEIWKFIKIKLKIKKLK